MLDVGTRPRIGTNAARENFIRTGSSKPAMLFHYSSFLLANCAGLLHDKDMGTDIREKMKEEVPTSGITLMLFQRSIPINEMVEALRSGALS